jgi:hypothetical protein
MKAKHLRSDKINFVNKERTLLPKLQTRQNLQPQEAFGEQAADPAWRLRASAPVCCTLFRTNHCL